MPALPSLRLVSLLISNILIPIACLIFATGFFPYKPFLPGLATFQEAGANEELGLLKEIQRPPRVFDKVIFMVVDALRSDFVYGHESGFDFVQSVIRNGDALPFTAHATPPTITMPRVKALTTGSVPAFLDLILNFAESDTTSTLAAQDTWLAQIRAHLHANETRSETAQEGRLFFYGDDTWLKLFPSFFAQSDGTSSFFVSDFTEVDNNVTRHVPNALHTSDQWDALVMHYLGLDHIGHKAGPKSPNMIPKQHEMDDIFKQIFQAMESTPDLQNTLLVLAGDHGMNSAGNHGGSNPGETSPALVFASPRFRSLKGRPSYAAPADPKEGTEFDYYRKVEQSDLVPTLAALLGLPIPRNNLGIVIKEMLGFWSTTPLITGNEETDKATNVEAALLGVEDGAVQLLYRNALQVLDIVRATFGEKHFSALAGSSMRWECRKTLEGKWKLSCLWSLAQRKLLAAMTDGRFSLEDQAQALTYFLETAQDTLSTTASSYDVPRLVGGIGISLLAVIFAFHSVKDTRASLIPLLAFALLTILYGVMMFASSYVEEEQHFWYWSTTAWLACLAARKASKDRSSITTTLLTSTLVLALHRLSVRWNQTGQKHAGEPDIARTFFPSHHIFLWITVIATYIYVIRRVATRTLYGIFSTEINAIIGITLVVPAFVFKLSFTQADAPELVQGLAATIRLWSAPIDLVVQARTVFTGLLVVLIAVVVHSIVFPRRRKKGAAAIEPTLAERLHDLLTLLLITQTRVNNVPLFLVFELQLQLLSTLMIPTSKSASITSSSSSLITATTLLLSYVSYFCMGGSNAISSIDLSNAYNGVSGYNVAAVGILLFCSNWAGPIWWGSAGVLLLYRLQNPLPPALEAAVANGDTVKSWIAQERALLREQADESTAVVKAEAEKDQVEGRGVAWMEHVAMLTLFVASSLAAVMVACTALRTHLFIWTVFSPKYLYAMAWSVGWHWGVTIGLGGLLYALSGW